MTILETDEATTAIVAALTAALDPIPVGDGRKPDGAGWNGPPAADTPFQGYVIVYAGVAELDGSIDAPKADATLAVQITAVSRTRAAADSLRRRARAQLLDPTFTPAGFTITWSSLEVGRPVDRDDSHGEALPLFAAIDVLHLHVTSTA